MRRVWLNVCALITAQSPQARAPRSTRSGPTAATAADHRASPAAPAATRTDTDRIGGQDSFLMRGVRSNV